MCARGTRIGFSTALSTRPGNSPVRKGGDEQKSCAYYDIKTLQVSECFCAALLSDTQRELVREMVQTINLCVAIVVLVETIPTGIIVIKTANDTQKGSTVEKFTFILVLKLLVLHTVRTHCRDSTGRQDTHVRCWSVILDYGCSKCVCWSDTLDLTAQGHIYTSFTSLVVFVVCLLPFLFVSSGCRGMTT